MKLVRTEGRPGEWTKVLGVVGVGLLLLARFVPWSRIPPLCAFRNTTGLPCPGCGMTRAFIHVTHLDFPAAFHVSPLGTVFAVGAVLAAIYAVLRHTRLEKGFDVELSRNERRVAIAGALVVGAANWAYLLVTGAATNG